MTLSHPDWKTIPWQETPKNLKDVLVDVLVDMPRLLEDLDSMQACKPANKQAELRQNLIQSCWNHDKRLMLWFRLVCGEENPGRHHSPITNEKDTVTRVAVIHGMSLFWTTCLILYSTLRTASGPEAELPDRTNPVHYVSQLAEAISILLQPRAGLYGKQSAVLLLELAIEYTMSINPLSYETDGLLKTFRSLKDGLDNEPLKDPS